MFRIESEWDLGLADRVYGTKEAAMGDLRREHRLQGIRESVESCFADGLYSLKELSVG